MIDSPLHIVESIRVALAERVLPQLQANSWVAGDVRASLALLTCLEDMLTDGKAMAGEANAAMAGFLRDASARTGVAFLTDALRAQMAEAIAVADAVEPGDLMGLEAAGRGLKSALSSVMAASRDGAAAPDPSFTEPLRLCLRQVAACEQKLAERAGNMSPF